MSDFKDINIGSLLQQIVSKNEIEISRICNFFKCSEAEIDAMYKCQSLDSEMLLKWSKLLEYDFFRIYTQHLILYSPPGNVGYNTVVDKEKSSLPQFRKNIYTKEVISFILEQIDSGEKTKLQIIEEYKIPKTTLYKWISKYNYKK